DHGAGREPYLRPASLVPACAPGAPGIRGPRLLRVVGRRPEVQWNAHHLLRHRKIELDLGSGSAGLLLAPLLLPSARPELRQSAGHQGSPVRDALLARDWRRWPAAGCRALSGGA